MVILFIVVSSICTSTRLELLDAHATDCCHTQRTKFPDDPRCRFTNIQKQLPAPFVVYADFDSILNPVDKDADTTQSVEVGGESSYHVFQEHIPCSFAALRMSRVDLQRITDIEIYHFVENSIRGGISMISTRHAQANRPSFPDTHDSSLPNQNLIYLDANNSYRWAMPQSLPTHGFRFLQQDEISALKLQELSDDAEDGYTVYSR